MKTHVVFVPRENSPEKMVCEAELIFGDEVPQLAGLRLVGFALWQGPDGEVYVTLPSRAFGAGHERKFFDFVRSTDGVPATVRGFKAWILAQYAAAKKDV